MKTLKVILTLTLLPLASGSDGVAKKSLHLKGWAADIKIDGVRTSALRDAAKALRAAAWATIPPTASSMWTLAACATGRS